MNDSVVIWWFSADVNQRRERGQSRCSGKKIDNSPLRNSSQAFGVVPLVVTANQSRPDDVSI